MECPISALWQKMLNLTNKQTNNQTNWTHFPMIYTITYRRNDVISHVQNVENVIENVADLFC